MRLTAQLNQIEVSLYGENGSLELRVPRLSWQFEPPPHKLMLPNKRYIGPRR